MAVGRRAAYAGQIPQIWAADLFSQAEDLTFWHNMEGPPGSSMPILRRDDLTQQPGDTIKFDITLALAGAGLTGDLAGSLLEGNEEALAFRQIAVAVDSLQHAVRWTKLGKVLIDHDMRGTALNQLRKWLAGKLDTAIFTELTGAGVTTLPTTAQWFAGTATTRDTVTDVNGAGRLSLTDITEIKAYAQSNNKIEPLVTENGNEYFGLVVHPYTAMSLKRDDPKWAQAQREAGIDGPSNPIFTGAVGMWDGVIIYVNNRVPRSNNANATPIAVSNNVFFGAQALSRGYAYYPDWTEEYFSYGQEQGIATWTVYGNKLNAFDLTSGGGAAASAFTAIGSLVLYASAVAPSA
jgi:N4-gp56 family major capsid protein